MSTACGGIQFWLDDENDSELDAREKQARAEHLLVCADCLEEMKGVVVQRATLREVFQHDEAQVPLTETLVASCVRAMARAARGETTSEAEGSAHAAG